MDFNIPVTKKVWVWFRFVLFHFISFRFISFHFISSYHRAGMFVLTLIWPGWSMPQTPWTLIHLLVSSLAMRDSALPVPSSSCWKGETSEMGNVHITVEEDKADVKNPGFGVEQICEQRPTNDLISTLWIPIFSSGRWEFHIPIKPTSKDSWTSLMVIAQYVLSSKFINWLCDSAAYCRTSSMSLPFPTQKNTFPYSSQLPEYCFWISFMEIGDISFYVPAKVLNTSRTFSHLILTTPPRGKYSYYLHFSQMKRGKI